MLSPLHLHRYLALSGAGFRRAAALFLLVLIAQPSAADPLTIALQTVPDAPTIGSATANTDSSVTVTFMPPFNDGGSPITSYSATCGTQSISGPASPLVVTGLNNGIAVTCTVFATNGVGNSVVSSPSNPVTPITVPAAPAIGGPIAGNGSVSVVFAPSLSDGGSPVTSYTATCDTQSNSGPTTPIVVSGLTNGVAVFCSVYATNAAGNSPSSGPTLFSATPATVPDAPTINTVTAGDMSVSIAFTEPVFNGGAAITGYTATCGPHSVFMSRPVLGPVDPITVTGLPNGSPVTCTVTATNAGSPGSNSTALGIGPPSAPSSSVTPGRPPDVPTLGIVTPGNGVVSVSFTPGSDGGSTITGYTATCGAQSASGNMSPIGVSGLTNGLSVTCTVAAINAFGTGQATGPSSLVTPATKPDPPTIGTAVAGNGTVTVAFTAPASNGGSPITGYTATCGGQSATGQASPLVVSNLMNGTAVTCTVVASNAVGPLPGYSTDLGTSLPSAASNSVTPGAVPGAPWIGAVTPGNGSVSVPFTAPGSDGGAPITSYTATCGTQSASGAVSPIVVTGLTNGQPVTCTVVATNAIGDSLASTPSTSVTPAWVPNAPTIDVVTAGNGEISVFFTAPTSDGGSPITGYSATCGGSTNSGSLSPIIVAGLSNGVAVTCTVVATNALGSSLPSSPSNSVTPSAPATVPGAPVIGTATGGNTTVSVQFSPPLSDGGSAILSYMANCGGQSQSGSASPITVTGLLNGTPVACTVIAINAVGMSLPSAMSNSVTPTGPSATQMAAESGNNQYAPVGSAVSVPPSVVVRDAANNPASGVSVTFAVVTGGGSVTGAVQTTNLSGVATVGSWTLGPSAGVGNNSLTATSGSLIGSPVTFTATAALEQPSVLDAPVTQVVAGERHTCALTTTGGVKCWGLGGDGQLGDGMLNSVRLFPVDVNGLTSGVVSIAAGAKHTCALTSSGGVKCWGDNFQGQLGDGTTIDRATAVDVSGLGSGIASLAAGALHTCALTTSGGVKCWGNNGSGQIGTGQATGMYGTPVAVTGLSGSVAGIAAGSWHTCALTPGGSVQCWGDNDNGQLGDGTSGTDRYLPVQVSGLATGIVAISAGAAHTCALTAGGPAKCWGSNTNGQLGDGSYLNRLIPTDLQGEANGLSAITAGGEHTCLVTSLGSVKCWGANGAGQLGDGTTTEQPSPVSASGLGGVVTALSLGLSHTCALTQVGGLKCWGSNDYGQIGAGTYGPTQTAPVSVSSLAAGASTVVAGSDFACALSSGGGVKCWGRNDRGQLGDGTTTSRGEPGDVSGLTTNVVLITAGLDHACATTSVGETRCWGGNSDGQLGDGTTTNRSIPVLVTGMSSPSTNPSDTWAVGLSAGSSYTCAVDVYGRVSCWGLNHLGQLGDGTQTRRLTPVGVVGHSGGSFIPVSKVDAGSTHTCVRTTVGAAECWGYNGQGQLGDGTTTLRTAPVNVPGLASGVADISAGGGQSCVVLSGGGVKCWGTNNYGQVGDGTSTTTLSPVDVSGLTAGVATVEAGQWHTCAVTSTGAMKCWGRNDYGELGNGATLSAQSSTVDVLGLTSGVARIAVGNEHTCALNTIGGVKCWGRNGYGQVGDATTTERHVPVSIRTGQFLTFTAPPLLTPGVTVSLTAAASSGLSVTFDTWTPSTCGIIGSVVTATSPGLCGIRASQGGDGNHAPTPQAMSLVPVVVPPVVGSPTATSVGGTTATLGGQVTSDGNSTITGRGVLVAVTATNASPQLGGVGVTQVPTTGGPGLFTVGVSGLSASTGYSFRAYATNAIGTGYSPVATFTTAAGAPGAPTIVSASPGAASVTVTFTAPASDGGSAVTGYTATCGAQSNSGPTSPISVSGLTNGIPVTCTVRATNVSGTGPDSAASSSVTPRTVPGAPAIGIATAGDASVSVSFSAPVGDGGSPITGYTATCGGQSNTSATSPIVVGGLPNGTAVTCTVVATNVAGSSAPSSASNSVVPAPAGPTPDALNWTVAHLAGADSPSEFADGTGVAARFWEPTFVSVDAAGNLYVSDTLNLTVRKVTPAGVVTTLAGQVGVPGTTDGPGATALFVGPRGLAVDSAQNIYVGDIGGGNCFQTCSSGLKGSGRIRKITPDGIVSTLVTGLSRIAGLAIDGADNLYFADSVDHVIRKVTAAGVVSDVAGTAGTQGSADGTGPNARFRNPEGVWSDASGNLLVADTGNHTIRQISAGGAVTTLAGLAGSSGYTDATGASARFNVPRGVAVVAGDVYVADSSNGRIRKIDPAGVVTTLAGGGQSGHRDGTGTVARFRGIYGMAANAGGDLYVAEASGGHSIRKVTVAGAVTSFAGFPGDKSNHVNGAASVARFERPHGVAVNAAGEIFVADWTHTVRKISGGVVSLLAGAADTEGSTNGTGASALFRYPADLALRASTGDLYLAGDNQIRVITPTGDVTTLAGNSAIGWVDGPGASARFNLLTGDGSGGLDVDASGNVYVADIGSHTIRKITPGGDVTTLAGLAESQGSTDGNGATARFRSPRDVAVDPAGNVYVSDTGNFTIRKITPDGTVSTLAGVALSSGSLDGLGSAARFSRLDKIALDASGDLLVGDAGSIRRVTADGVVTTLAGSRGLFWGYVNGTGTNAHIGRVTGLAVDGNGAVVFADDVNDVLRLAAPGLTDTAMAASKLAAPGTTVQLGVAAGSAGVNYLWSILSAPSGSVASILNPTSATPSFTCDVAGRYVLQLVAQCPTGTCTAGAPLTSITQVSLTCATPTLSLGLVFAGPTQREGDSGTRNFLFTVSSDVPSAGMSVQYATSDLSATAGSDYVATSGTLTFGPGERYKTLRVPIQGDTTPEAVEAFRMTLSNPVGAILSPTATSADGVIVDDDSKPEDVTLGTLAGHTAVGSEDGTGPAARFNSPRRLAFDSTGNLFVGDANNHTIRKMTPAGVVTTFAGLAGEPGFADGQGAAARFRGPRSMAFDSDGNMYVADTLNQVIRKVTPSGLVSTLAGQPEEGGYADGIGSAARFGSLASLVFDPATNSLIVADSENHAIRRVSLSGEVSLVLGTPGVSGSLNSTALSSTITFPRSAVVTSSGDIYVSTDCLIRRLSGTTLTTVTGKDSSPCPTAVDGAGELAQANFVPDMAVDTAGNVILADVDHAVRRLTPGGVLSTVAGTLKVAGSVDATGSAARFSAPQGVAISAAGNIVVGDSSNNVIRSVSPGGVVTTIAGALINPSTVNGTLAQAEFRAPRGIARDANSNLYISDSSDHVIRRITPSGVVTTLAGSPGVAGSLDGTGASATFNIPNGIQFVGGFLYVTEQGGHTLRRIDPVSGTVVTLAGLAGSAGSTDGTGSAARFRGPRGLASDAAGNLYVADGANHTIRVVTPAGVVTTLAGSAGVSGSADGSGGAARFNQPADVAVDGSGNVFVVDSNNRTIRRISPSGGVTTIAGSVGISSFYDGTGTAARFSNPRGIAILPNGDLIVTDSQVLRRVTTAGVVTTVAGDLTTGNADGSGASARLWFPDRIEVGPGGSLFVTDSATRTIRATLSLSQAITFGAAPSIVAGSSGTVSATASSELPVSFTSQTPAVCTVTGVTVSGGTAGLCIIAANQTGSVVFSPAPQVTQSFSVAPLLTAPGAPTGVSAVAGNGLVTVSFTPPVNDGGSPITSYTATCGGQSASGTTSPITVTGLANGTPVTCTVLATNSIGMSPSSAITGSVTPATVPNPPTIGAAVARSESVSVSFAPPVGNGGLPITSYTASCGSQSASGATSPIMVTGLANGTAVTCTVVATNAVGSSAPSDASNSVTPVSQAFLRSFPFAEEATAIQQTGDEGYIVAGRYGQLSRLNSTGTPLWSRSLNTIGGDTARAVVAASDGSFLLVGDTQISVTRYFWIAKVDATGNLQWSKLFGASGSNSIAYAATEVAGGFVIAGSTNASGAGLDDIWVVKVDASGSLLWQETHGGARDDTASGIVATPDGGVAIVGTSNSFQPGGAGQHVLLLKLEAEGAVQWSKRYGADFSYDRGRGIQRSASGYVIAGSRGSSVNSSLLLIKTNLNGDTVDLPTGTCTGCFVGVYKPTQLTSAAEGVSAAQAADGGVLAVGSAFGRIWFLKTDSTGAVSWSRYTGDLGAANGGVPTADGGFVAVGSKSAGALLDLWMLKLDSLGGGGDSCSTLQNVASTALVNGIDQATSSFASGALTAVSIAVDTIFSSVSLSQQSQCLVGDVPPVAPTIGIATPGNMSASVTFTPPAANGGSVVTSYTATCGTRSATGTQSPILVGGLQNGTPVTCVVVATNNVGSSPASAESNSVIPVTVPDPPMIGTATAGNGFATVSFSAPAGDGGTAVVGYTATCGGQSASGLGSPLTVGGLTNGVSVSCTVVATNAVGSSAPSEASNAVTPATVPGAPIIGTATAGNTTAVVTFTPPMSSGGLPILSYTATCGSQTQAGASSPLTVTGLVNGVTVTCNVSATNAIGAGTASADSSPITPLVGPGTPTGTAVLVQPVDQNGQSPLTLTFASVTASGVTSMLQGPVANAPPSALYALGNPATAYDITTTATYSGAVQICVSFSGVSYTSDADLRLLHYESGAWVDITTSVNPTTRIVCGSTTSLSPFTVASRITVPGAPIIGAVAPGNGSVAVSFTAPASNGGSPITSYTAVCATQSGTGSAPPITVSGLINGTAVTCRVFATNAAGDSALSGASSAVAPRNVPAAPTMGAATAGDRTVTVSFTPSTTDGGSPITGHTATCGAQNNSGSTSPITVGSLTNGVAVTCTVVATNAAGSSAPSAPSNSVTPSTTPGAPSISGVTPGNGSATVAFGAPASNGGSPITAYSATCGGHEQSGPSSPITVSGLTNGVAVTCTVVATNAAGSGAPSSGFTVTPRTVPGAPTIGTAEAFDASVTVSFAAPSSDGGAAITDYIATCGSQSQSGSGSPIRVNGLANGTAVTCQVVATNAAGNSPPSAASNVVTPLAPVIPAIAISDATVDERTGAVSNASFVVTLSPASSLTVSASFAVIDGTASAFGDLGLSAGTVTFAPGVTSQTIDLPVLGDSLDEDDETFTVRLSSPTNATLARADGMGTIRDDDRPRLLSPTGGSLSLSQLFTWSPGTAVSGYWLSIGTTTGGGQVYDRPQSGTGVRVEDLRGAGGTAYVRLWYYRDRTWRFRDHVFGLANAQRTLAELVSPAPGSVIGYWSQNSSPLTLSWTQGAGALGYGVSLGWYPGDSSMYQNWGISGQSVVVNSAQLNPNYMGTYWVRLGTRYQDGWQYRDYALQRINSSGVAQLTAPSPGAVLAATTTFKRNSTGGSGYRYWVAQPSGASGGSFPESGVSIGVSNPGYGTLDFRVDTQFASYYKECYFFSCSTRVVSSWYSNWYRFRLNETREAPGRFVSPVAFGRLTGASATLGWTAGTNVSAYYLRVGTTPGGSDIYSRSFGRDTLSASVPGLPNDGRPIYAQLVTYYFWGPFSRGWDVENIAFNSSPADQPWVADGAYGPGASLADGPSPLVEVDTVTVDDSGGNGNGVADPDECLAVTVKLRNVGAGAAMGLRGELKSPAGAVSASGRSTFADIAPSGTSTSTNSFRVTLPASTPVGQNAALELSLEMNGGTSTLPISLPVGSSAPVQTFAAGVSTAIPDLDPDGVGSPVVVSGIQGAIRTVRVRLAARHPYSADLRFSLVGPDGTSVALASNVGLDGRDFGTGAPASADDTLFDDEATTSIVDGAAPFIGSFRPQESLTAFAGKSGAALNGTWTLVARDLTGEDTGQILDWALEITPWVASGGGACLPDMSVEDLTAVEGQAGQQSVNVGVLLSQSSESTVTVGFTTRAGSATEGSDYQAASGTLTFEPGQTRANATVMINGDLQLESGETFEIVLSGAVRASILDSSGVVTISDDDSTAPSVSTPTSTGLTSTSATLGGTVSSDGGAAISERGFVYAPTSTNPSPLIGGSGVTRVVVPGSTGAFSAGITGLTASTQYSFKAYATNAAGAGYTAVSIFTTLAPPIIPKVFIGDVTVTEGAAGTSTSVSFPVSLSVAATSTVTLDYATADGTATAGSDYTGKTGTLTIAAGETSATITVLVSGDGVAESNEGFAVILSNPINATIARRIGLGTIRDDDRVATPNAPARPQASWQEFFAVDTLETPYIGDFDGDGKTDIITFTRQNPNAIGDVYVALSDGAKFGANTKWHDFFAISTDESVIIGDYNGDGKADIATWLGKTSRQAYVALSTGTGMTTEAVWVNSIGTDPSDLLISGDVNGDGKADLVAFARKQGGKVYVALSDGTKFAEPQMWHNFFAVSTFERPRVADVNGDGKADIVTFATDSPTAFGDVYVATSDGTKFVGPTGAANDSSKWHDFFAIRPTEEIRIGDLNGDGKDDFFTFLPPPFAQCYSVLSQGTSMAENALWAEAVAPLLGAGDNVYVGDVNGDGKDDIIIFAQKEGKVFVSLAP